VYALLAGYLISGSENKEAERVGRYGKGAQPDRRTDNSRSSGNKTEQSKVEQWMTQ